MNTLLNALKQITELSARDPNPLYANLAHLQSEVGELAQAIEVHEGHSTKKLDEPIIGEVADVIQCALAILCKATGSVDAEVLFMLLGQTLGAKNAKWEKNLPPAKSKLASLAGVTRYGGVRIPEELTDVTGLSGAPKAESKPKPVTTIAAPAAWPFPNDNVYPRHPHPKKLADLVPAFQNVAAAPVRDRSGDQTVYVNIRRGGGGKTRGERKVVSVKPRITDKNQLAVAISNGDTWFIDPNNPPEFLDFSVGPARRKLHAAHLWQTWNE